ncbi:MAG TPA: CHASE domain-containing protein [Bacteroidales bacterium]|nr:CHASE domain-containing protein [Bacteroidales bacterium]
MSFPLYKYKQLMTGFSLKETILTIGVLITGLLLTSVSVVFNRNNVREATLKDFENHCNDLRIKIETRLEEHAQLLRGGKAFFAVSDTVTAEEMHGFYMNTKVNEFLPGIQGFGYSLIVKKEDIKTHEEHFRKVYQDYKPDYKIYPDYERENYSAIIMLEPHNERNKVALGYDMYSDSIRGKAMAVARDSNKAMLTNIVKLVQEIDEDIQPGVLMYIPDYRKDMPSNTVEERRRAIRGWVYSPYRMRDLMEGIVGPLNTNYDYPLEMKIYDDTIISEQTLMFDSRDIDSVTIPDPNMNLRLISEFNERKWTLVFEGRRDEMSIFHKEQLTIIGIGLLVTILLFILSMMQIRSNIRRLQIEELNRQLEKLNSDKDRFIAILSHDLKSPFTSILGFLELLRNGIRKFKVEEIENHVQIIDESARNTYKLLEDLLTWVRAHAGKIPFKPQKVSLGSIYDSIVNVLIPLAESKKTTINYLADKDISVFADVDMLKFILRNLISNSIKFTEGGSITISAEYGNNGITISITDTGIGIRNEQKSGLFDISKILPSSGTKGEKGTGLGLIICKEFIDRHKGRIWYSSEWGKGSTFNFYLPDK